MGTRCGWWTPGSRGSRRRARRSSAGPPANCPLWLGRPANAGIAPADLVGVVTHQANLRIIESLVRQLGLRENAVIARDVVDSGNTSAASVPLALSKLVERGELPSGASVLLFSFGGGLSWAGLVVICP